LHLDILINKAADERNVPMNELAWQFRNATQKEANILLQNNRRE